MQNPNITPNPPVNSSLQNGESPPTGWTVMTVFQRTKDGESHHTVRNIPPNDEIDGERGRKAAVLLGLRWIPYCEAVMVYENYTDEAPMVLAHFYNPSAVKRSERGELK